MAEEARTVLIMHATETGNSLDAAERIAKECRRRHFHTRLVSADMYPLEELVFEPTVLFVLSTTGNGTEPHMMTPLWKLLLRADLPNDLFEGMEYAVFGLGDSTYQKFCWASKKLCRRMQGLGAKEIVAIGLADEQDRFGVEGALGPWIDRLFKALLIKNPLPANLLILPSNTLWPARASISPVPEAVTLLKNPLDEDGQASYYNGIVKSNNRITAKDWFQDVRHIELEFMDDISYDPGDIAVIHPRASASAVDTLIKRLGWESSADGPIMVSSTSNDQPLPTAITQYPQSLRTLLTSYLDINAIPRRSFFELLRHFTKDELEKEKLEDFCTPEGQDDLYDYVYKVRRTIFEVLIEFRHLQIAKEYIFDLFPPLRPRLFSIASSNIKYPKSIHLCVAIVQYRTKLKTSRKGTCTTWLSGLAAGYSFRVGIKKSTIQLPPVSMGIPLVCVGPGTGIAPIRSILQDRIGSNATDNTLYFGCRSHGKDYHYGNEWEEYAQNGKLMFKVAYSRDQDEKVYVQDLIREDSKRIWELLGERGGWLYISGSSNKMPSAVRKAVEDAVSSEGGLSQEEVKVFIAKMEREGRLIEECWS